MPEPIIDPATIMVESSSPSPCTKPWGGEEGWPGEATVFSVSGMVLTSWKWFYNRVKRKRYDPRQMKADDVEAQSATGS